eukprot:5012178-Amphidinium_carterae.1
MHKVAPPPPYNFGMGLRGTPINCYSDLLYLLRSATALVPVDQLTTREQSIEDIVWFPDIKAAIKASGWKVQAHLAPAQAGRDAELLRRMLGNAAADRHAKLGAAQHGVTE